LTLTWTYHASERVRSLFPCGPGPALGFFAMNTRRLLIAYALLNAVLYSVLLPLWEGFDEPFHFAYVQQLANGQGLPDSRTARLSGEVGASLLLAPASTAVKQNLPRVMSFSEYFSLPTPGRADLRRQLNEIPAGLRWQPAPFMNYQAHHPPLAYTLLAIPERLLAGLRLPVRVVILRILIALVGSFLLCTGARRLFQQIAIPESYSAAALFCLFSSQMTWAASARIGNDWLAVPAAVWTLVALNRYEARRSPRAAAASAVILSAGLLTKAYFLALVPLLVGMFVWRKRWRDLALASVLVCGLAGPWYARNLIQYGVLTGTQESRNGVDTGAILNAAPALEWQSSIPASIRSALWTGNNSFLTFSATTLNLLIGCALMALLFWAASRKANPEWITLSYCVLFVIALGYATTASYIYTHGAAHQPSPWYAQVLSAPLLGLALLGASRWGEAGRIVATLLVVLFGYILAATYAVKLIPLYGGYEGRVSLGSMTTLYGRRLGKVMSNLDTVSLAPAAVICVLAAMTISLVVIQQVILIRRLNGSE